MTAWSGYESQGSFVSEVLGSYNNAGGMRLNDRIPVNGTPGGVGDTWFGPVDGSNFAPPSEPAQGVASGPDYPSVGIVHAGGFVWPTPPTGVMFAGSIGGTGTPPDAPPGGVTVNGSYVNGDVITNDFRVEQQTSGGLAPDWYFVPDSKHWDLRLRMESELKSDRVEYTAKLTNHYAGGAIDTYATLVLGTILKPAANIIPGATAAKRLVYGGNSYSSLTASGVTSFGFRSPPPLQDSAKEVWPVLSGGDQYRWECLIECSPAMDLDYSSGHVTLTSPVVSCPAGGATTALYTVTVHLAATYVIKPPNTSSGGWVVGKIGV